MSPKRGDDVAPPPVDGEYQIRYDSTDAVNGWRELCKQAPGNVGRMWQEMRTNPAPKPPTERHHQLKGDYATAVRNGETLPQWQLEVTGAGRVWYLFDEARRTLWLRKASVGHPRETDR